MRAASGVAPGGTRAGGVVGARVRRLGRARALAPPRRAPARARAASRDRVSDAEALARHLSADHPHFAPNDAGEYAALGVDRALASWDHADATDPAALAAHVARASGLDEALAAETERARVGGGGGGARDDAADDDPRRRGRGRASATSRASASARGRAASMISLALSSLHLRGTPDACRRAATLLSRDVPKLGVAPDVVAFSLVADLGRRTGARDAARETLEAARISANAGSGSSSRARARRLRKKRGGGGGGGAKKGPEKKRPEEGAASASVLWEDEFVAVASKPAGVLTHAPPGKPSKNDAGARTLADALLDRYGDAGLSALNGPEARGIVHRLDKPTSGAMLVAKTDEAHAALVAAFFQRRVRKTYLALCEGHPGAKAARAEGGEEWGEKERGKTPVIDSGTVEADADGRPARSEWRVVETFGAAGDARGRRRLARAATLVEVRPTTGRKHQVRQHMGLELDAPLVGDPLYRTGRPARTPAALGAGGGEALFLHSARVELEHPFTGETIRVDAPLPPAFEAALEKLRRAERRASDEAAKGG